MDDWDDDQPFYEYRDQIKDVYNAIAENRNEDALKLLYELCGDACGLYNPRTQLRLRGGK